MARESEIDKAITGQCLDNTLSGICVVRWRYIAASTHYRSYILCWAIPLILCLIPFRVPLSNFLFYSNSDSDSKLCDADPRAAET
jgi:hypothetical protein